MSNITTSKLINKNFILFFIVIAQAALGTAISDIALAFLVLKLTGSSSAMALTLGLRVLPSLFIPLIATWLDRIEIKLPLMAGFLIRGILMVFLYSGISLKVIGIDAVYIVTFISGILGTICMPSCQIIIPNLVTKKNLERANSVLNMAEQSMSLLGLLFGGVMVAFLGPIISIFIEGICYIFAGMFIPFITVKLPVQKSNNAFIRDMVLGFNIIRHFKVVTVITFMCFFINIFFAFIEVYMPLHMNQIKNGGLAYGIFMALMVSGMIIGSFTIAILGEKFKTAKSIGGGWLCLALGFCGLSIGNSFFFCLVWAVFLGIAISIINTSVRVIMQKTIAFSYRGRVNGISVALSSFGMPLAFITLSAIVHLIKFSSVFMIGGVVAIGFSVLWVIYIKSSPSDVFEHEYILSDKLEVKLADYTSQLKNVN